MALVFDGQYESGKIIVSFGRNFAQMKHNACDKCRACGQVDNEGHIPICRVEKYKLVMIEKGSNQWGNRLTTRPAHMRTLIVATK